MTLDRHTCCIRVGDFRFILIISLSFLTMFSLTDVNDVPHNLRKYICIENDTLDTLVPGFIKIKD